NRDPTSRTAVRFQYSLTGTIDLAQHQPRLLEKLHATLGQLNAACGALEKRHLQIVFELADMVAERWLSYSKVAGCSRETAEFGNPSEVSELLQIHNGSLQVTGRPYCCQLAVFAR